MTDTRPPGIAALYRALWRHAAGRRRMLAGAMALLMLAQAVKLAIPWFAAEAVNALQLSGLAGLDQAARWMLLMLGAAVFAWVLHGPGRAMERLVAIEVRGRFADGLYARLMALPLPWHEANHSGDTLHRLDKSSRALFGFAQNQFIYLQNVVNLVGPIVALLLISPATGLAALVGYLAVALLLVRFDAATLRLAQAENREERRYAAALTDCLGNVSTVLTLRLQAATRRLLGRRLAAVAAPFRRNVMLNEVKWCAVDLLNNALRVGLVMLYGWLAWRASGTVLIGGAVMIFQYAQQIGGVVSAMAGHYHELIRYQADFAAAGSIIDAPVGAAPAAVSLPPDWRRIEIADLAFAYPGGRGDGPALSGIGLTLRRGERLALVGESGAGKSTLLRVLAGLYHPDRVVIAVDGVAQPGVVDLGTIATLLPQDPETFETTIEHNLTLGLERDPASLRRACEIASFTPVLAGCPAGLATEISERGVNLSGGQKQRLALARGILAAGDSALLMLDEPTSSVDPATEARIYAALFAAFPDACLVASVHRLHLLDRFDRIVLMEQGRIVDEGSLVELRDRQPVFQALWRRSVGGTTHHAAA